MRNQINMQVVVRQDQTQLDASKKFTNEAFFNPDGTPFDFGSGDGADGLSAYEVAVENGFVGTEQEWLDSLVGPPGLDSTEPGPPGENGTNGIPSNTFSVDIDGPVNTGIIDAQGFYVLPDIPATQPSVITIANDTTAAGALIFFYRAWMVGDDNLEDVTITLASGSFHWYTAVTGTEINILPGELWQFYTYSGWAFGWKVAEYAAPTP